MIEILGELLKVASTYLLLRTIEGRKKVPYTEVNIVESYDGMSLEELRGKKVKIIIFEDGTVQVNKPNE